MPEQQIVYHMLRCFVKTKKLTEITDNAGAKLLCNYHLKTLMMWACELKPRSWWTGGLNFVRMCVELLHNLAVWLNDAHCEHYFLNNCNLFDHNNKLNIQLIATTLSETTETWLAEWFICNYIQICAPFCPGRIARLFDNVVLGIDVNKSLSEIFKWRLYYSSLLHLISFGVAELIITECVFENSLTSRRCLFWLKELAKLDRVLSLYFTAVALLNVAHKARKSLHDEMLDVLATTCLQSNDSRPCRNARHSSVLSLSQAAILMKVVVNNSRSTVQLIEIELSKAYLHRALRCKDSDSHSIYYLANVYLAVLYYNTGQYQTAIDHCTLVTRSYDHSRCNSHVVQGELLPKINNEIDNVLGLAVFYQYVRTAALSQQQTQHVSVFTTELFAHYLHIRCLSVTQCRQHTMKTFAREIRGYRKSLHESPTILITDLLSFKLVCVGTNYPGYFRKMLFAEDQSQSVTSGQLDTSELAHLLKQSAVEHLTTYRELKAQKFISVAVIVTTEYEALHAYKCGEYQRCLQLSTHNLRMLLAIVLAFPEFIQLMDDDIVSLAGLMLLIKPSCIYDRRHISVLQLSLSLYLITQCQMKLHQSVTSPAETLHYIAIARRKAVCQLSTFDQLLLKFTIQKILRYRIE